MNPTDAQATLDTINRRAYANAHAVQHYARSAGHVDRGEVAAFAWASEIEPGPLLDIGMGGGRTVPLLAGIGTRYTGIDYIDANIAAASAHFPETDLRVMDARALDFPDASFRLAVFSFNGMDSVDHESRCRILAEIFRVLEPGGRFVFSGLNLDGPAAREKFRVPLRVRQGPSRFVRDLANLPRWAVRTGIAGVRTYARARRAQFQSGDGYALKQPSVHDYGMMLMFTSVPAQIRQLHATGFILHAVLDEQGLALPPSWADRSSRWCYYLAVKPDDQPGPAPARRVAAHQLAEGA
jgi:SAM-dependent methyltransferase